MPGILLQLFTDGHASIPRLSENNGHIGVGKTHESQSWFFDIHQPTYCAPVSAFTMCLHEVRLPTDLEEARSLPHSRVPLAQHLLTQVVKVVRYIRIMMPTFRDKPGLRESIAFLQAVATENIQGLSAEVIDDHLGFIARVADDLTNLELVLPRLEKVVPTAETVIDQ